MTERPAIGIGLMSGTSLDGMDAALVRFTGPTHADLIAFVTRPYSAAERASIQRGLDGANAAELARLHAAIGEWAADAVEQLLAHGTRAGVRRRFHRTAWADGVARAAAGELAAG